MPIPRILHQTWKVVEIPAEYREWQLTWKEKHPSFGYKLWTDSDLYDLVACDYPHLLHVYESYPKNVSRADLGRYLVLQKYGGVYVDLDCECLRPIDALIANAEFVIASEPEEHEGSEKVVARGLDKILCPSFIASSPGHAFWSSVLDLIPLSARESEVLDATGPFLLSRALKALGKSADVTVLPPEIAYPFSRSDCETGNILDIEYWEWATRDAYLIHYWCGGWWKGSSPSAPKLPETFAASVIGEGQSVSASPPAESPTISCIMVLPVGSGAEPAAVVSYLQQTHPNRELIVVGVDEDQNILNSLTGRGRSDIRLIHAPLADAETATALAASAAQGEYICMWDAETISDPQRLEYQYRVLSPTGSQGSFISSPLVWERADERLAISESVLSRRSLLCEKSRFLTGVEGAPESLDILLQSSRLVAIDFSRLCVECVDEPASGSGGRPLRRVYTGQRYGAVLAELGKRIPGLASPEAKPDGSVSKLSVNLVRFVSDEMGLGVASAGTASALKAADIPFTEDFGGVRSGQAAAVDHSADHDVVTLLHINPDHMVRYQASETARNAFTVASWVWEAAGVPDFWQGALPFVDEIWVPSSFVANSVAAHVSCPVVTIPHVVEPPVEAFERGALGLSRDKFLFLFVFDALSNLDRKNPEGLIHAYCNAFDPADDAELILKCKNLTTDELNALHEVRRGRPDIRIINQTMSRPEVYALIAACDCYVSLHRAEGFGLTMAEAMFYGKPVIATGYSGNLDFMAGGSAFLVDYKITATEKDTGYYRAGTQWADPDLNHASTLMRSVMEHREIARGVGRTAAQKMRDEYSPEAVGRRIRDRLSLLMTSGALRKVQRGKIN